LQTDLQQLAAALNSLEQQQQQQQQQHWSVVHCCYSLMLALQSSAGMPTHNLH